MKRHSPNCENCNYCQIRFVERELDNSYRCKIMKYKECHDETMKGFNVMEHSPTWCPLKKGETNDETDVVTTDGTDVSELQVL